MSDYGYDCGCGCSRVHSHAATVPRYLLAPYGSEKAEAEMYSIFTTSPPPNHHQINLPTNLLPPFLFPPFHLALSHHPPPHHHPSSTTPTTPNKLTPLCLHPEPAQAFADAVLLFINLFFAIPTTSCDLDESLVQVLVAHHV